MESMHFSVLAFMDIVESFVNIMVMHVLGIRVNMEIVSRMQIAGVESVL